MDKEKGFFDHLKDGFKPMGARAQESVEEDRRKSGDQLRLDMKESRRDRLEKVKKGFFNRKD